jgi:hypothetical protein
LDLICFEILSPQFDWSLLNQEMGVNENWRENLDAREEVNWRNLKLWSSPNVESRDV